MSSTAISAIGIAVLALLLGGYIAQKNLPPPKPKIIGIDYGTTYSGAGFYEPGVAVIRVIPDSQGRKTIPSVIHYRAYDDIVIGHEALINSETDSANVIYDSKRFIGRLLSDQDLEKEAVNYNFKIRSHNGGVCFEVLSNSNKTCLAPERFASFIIKHLKEIAEKNISRPVEMAVMSVPADFDQRQRNFTKLAAKLAGIEVVRIINEPTAAALAYGLHKRSGTNFVMVVDIGGGTSDISLLNIQGGMFITTAMAGNNRLGGQDFNQNLFNFFKKKIEEKYGHDLWTFSENFQNLRMAVEKLKIDLTSSENAELNSSLVFKQGDKDRTEPFSFVMTRNEFEQLNGYLFDKVIELVKIVLNSVEMEPSEVDEVVLVGGSTRIPKIRQIIEEYFQKKPNTAIDPETAVIHGVALQAAIFGNLWPLQVSAIEIQHSNVKKIKVS